MNDRLHSAALAVLPDADSTARARPPARRQRRPDPAGHADRAWGGHDFRLPGGAVLPLYDALYAEPRLRHVLVRHEQAAVHAAEGYARSTGRTGVVFVTSGPGMANTTSGLLDAMCDSIPVLCISGRGHGRDRHRRLPGMRRHRHLALGDQVEHPGPRGGRRGRRGEPRLRTDAPGRPGPVLLDFPATQLAVPHDADIDVPAAPRSRSWRCAARAPTGRQAGPRCRSRPCAAPPR